MSPSAQKSNSEIPRGALLRYRMSSPPFDRVNAYIEYMNQGSSSPVSSWVSFLQSRGALPFNAPADAIPPRRTQYFDSCLQDNLKTESVEISSEDPNIASTVFSLTVTPQLANATGNLHGGAVALVFDMCTSVTISAIAREGFWDSGHVSRTINCTYLRPAPVGTEVLVECEIVHLGKRQGMVRGVIRDKTSKKVCYTCEHGKAATGMRPPEFSGKREKL